MAEFGAHLTTAATELPTIFEVLAQDNLTTSLRPAFAHLLKVVAEISPARLSFLQRWRDEGYAAVELVLQHLCLRSCGASFAEQFYGLRRVAVGARRSRSLPTAHHLRSLLCLVAVPYLRLKLDAAFERLSRVEQGGLKKSFVHLYPLFLLTWEMLVLFYSLRYALGRGQFPSPLYWLARTKLVTLDEGDNYVNPLVALWKEARLSNSWTAVPGVVYRRVTNQSREMLTAALSLGSFFLQVVEWWFTAGQLVSLPVSLLRPPSDLPEGPGGASGRCLVCGGPLTNAAVLATSGYRNCYGCVYEHVKRHGACPVTKLPSSTSDIVRLYSASGRD